MIIAISYIVAVILTIIIALVLYPIAALFWILGLLGKLSDSLFTFTRNIIKALWRDINGTKIGSSTSQNNHENSNLINDGNTGEIKPEIKEDNNGCN